LGLNPCHILCIYTIYVGKGTTHSDKDIIRRMVVRERIEDSRPLLNGMLSSTPSFFLLLDCCAHFIHLESWRTKLTAEYRTLVSKSSQNMAGNDPLMKGKMKDRLMMVVR